MDSKILKDSKLADLSLSLFNITEQVQNIPGASLNSGNVELDLSNFADEAEVILAKFGAEVATVTVADQVATLDFTSAVTDSDIVEIVVRIKL